jgi:hypothetical protein
MNSLIIKINAVGLVNERELKTFNKWWEQKGIYMLTQISINTGQSP